MDERVNCMACLVADESDMIDGVVVTVGVVTHALTPTGSRTIYYLCAFEKEGMLRRTYWEAQVAEDDIESHPVRGSRATHGPRFRG